MRAAAAAAAARAPRHMIGSTMLHRQPRFMSSSASSASSSSPSSSSSMSPTPEPSTAVTAAPTTTAVAPVVPAASTSVARAELASLLAKSKSKGRVDQPEDLRSVWTVRESLQLVRSCPRRLMPAQPSILNTSDGEIVTACDCFANRAMDVRPTFVCRQPSSPRCTASSSSHCLKCSIPQDLPCYHLMIRSEARSLTPNTWMRQPLDAGMSLCGACRSRWASGTLSHHPPTIHQQSPRPNSPMTAAHSGSAPDKLAGPSNEISQFHRALPRRCWPKLARGWRSPCGHASSRRVLGGHGRHPPRSPRRVDGLKTSMDGPTRGSAAS